MGLIQDIDINLIDTNKEQPRKHFDKDKQEALKKSIKKDGLLQPIVVRPMQDGRYQIIAGECRYRALKDLGEESIPSIVLDADDKKALDLALLENEVRSDLTPLEKAEAIEEYKKRNRVSYDKIAEILGMTPSNVSNITSLNKLDDKIKEKLRKEPSDYPLRSLMTVARISDPKKQRIAFSELKNRLKNQDSKKQIDSTKKNILLFQEATRDLNKIGNLDKQIFEALPLEAEELSKSVANLLTSLLSSDFNALNLDELKTAITEIASKLSAESANAQN